MKCLRCGSNRAVSDLITLTAIIPVCSACRAIELHHIARRIRAQNLRSSIGCEHTWSNFQRGRRANAGRFWWHRQCYRCHAEDDECSANKPVIAEEDISWIML